VTQPTEFLSDTLSSGIQVVGQPMPGVESAAIGILVGAGARDERAAEMGVSHFTEQTLFRGTKHLDARQLSDRFDAMGIDYDSSAGLEMTLVSAVLLGSRLPEAIELLSDVVRFPSFPADAVENVRTLLLQELRQREDRPPQKTMDLLRQTFFAGSPLGNDVLGTEETIAGIDRGTLVRYWGERYTANDMAVSVAGNFDWPVVLDLLNTATLNWPLGSGRSRLEPPRTHGGTTVLIREGAQENVAFAFPGVPVSDPSYYAAAILSQVLGGSSNSRLYQEVREKRGLAYAIQARFDGLESAGLYRIYVGTTPERARESVEVIMGELKKLEDSGITEDELHLAKTRLKSQMVMRSEGTFARMAANLRSWWFEGRLYSLEDIKQRIDGVTAEHVGNLVRRLRITDNLLAAAVGPQTEEQLFGGLLTRA
jgi:predicted Zn-dependent peptidase